MKLPRRFLFTVYPAMKLPTAPPMPKTISTTVMKAAEADAPSSRNGRTNV